MASRMGGRVRIGAVVVALVVALLPAGTAHAAPPIPVVRDIRSFACHPEVMPAAGFVDIRSSVFAIATECLAWYGITSGGPAGLPPDHYGPRLEVGRGQMASFLAQTLDHVAPELLGPGGTGGTGDRFVDIDGNVHAVAINRLAEAGLVSGGPAGLPDDEFGPALVVTRGQMASFIHRVHSLANGGDELRTGIDFFDDDNRVVHEQAIDALAGVGIVGGRSVGAYAPEDPVRRDAMAAFVLRAVDLLIETGVTTPPRAEGGGVPTTTVVPATTTTTVTPTSPTTLPVPEVVAEQATFDLPVDVPHPRVVLSGDTAVAPSSVPIAGSAEVQESVRVLVRSPDGWTTQAELVADDWRRGDGFGVSLAIDGDTVVVGAPDHDAGDAPRQGAAYVFVRSGTTWSQQAKLVVAGGGQDDRIGKAVAISGGTVMVSSRHKPSPGVRAVHVFVRLGPLWIPEATLDVPDSAHELDHQTTLAIEGDTAVIGTPLDNGSRGSAHVYVRSGVTWTFQDTLTDPEGVAIDLFGLPVVISGDTIAVAASRFFYPGAGAVHVFVRSGTAWTEQVELADPDSGDPDTFGISVDLEGDTLVVGSPLLTAEPGDRRGSAHVYVRSGSTWIETERLVTTDDRPLNLFGGVVAMSGPTVLVVAPGHPDQRDALVYEYRLASPD